MNVSPTPELEELVHERVRSGRYASASGVVREALRLLADRDGLRELRLKEVRAKVAEGLRAAADQVRSDLRDAIVQLADMPGLGHTCNR